VAVAFVKVEVADMRVPLVDLRAQHAVLASELESAIGGLVRSSELVLGRTVECFEGAVAGLLHVEHAVGVSSCSDALVVALTALGVGPGDEVVTTPFSFFATAEAIARVGASPVFADVEPLSLQIDVREVEARLTPRTRAIVPVHLYGSAAPIDALLELAGKAGVAIVEDAAQAFGSGFRGRTLGTWGALGCYSFFPAKVLGALGDGGLVVTRDAALAAKCRRLRQHGRGEQGGYAELGGNFRLDAIQAAALSVKLPHLSAYVEARRRHAAFYDAALGGVSGLAPVARHEEWNGAIYTVRVLGGRRDAVRRFLADRGVDTGVYYPRPLHHEPALARFGVRERDLPHCERAAQEVLSLPLYPELSEAQRAYVVEALHAALA
jgi:dTDP-4-amino-4,6-dideoxygalactose transaminase